MIYVSVQGKLVPGGAPVIRVQVDDGRPMLVHQCIFTGPSLLRTSHDGPCERAGGVHTWVESSEGVYLTLEGGDVRYFNAGKVY